MKGKDAAEIKQENEMKLEQIIARKKLEKCHMKMVYDILNESLDALRPFGLPGKPFPWRINAARLSFTEITEYNMDRVLGLAIAKILKWGSFLCGFIPERIESPDGGLMNIDDEYLN